jgi:predicted permease
MFFESAFKDLRHAVRILLKTPGFTAVAVLVLALGIGANSTMFTLVNNLIFRPRFCRQPEQIVGVYSHDQSATHGYRTFSYPNFKDVQARNTVFSDLLAFDMSMVGITEGELTRRVFASCVSANYFTALGVRMLAGRGFLPEEETPGSEIPVVVVSYQFWKRRSFDPDLVGQSLVMNGRRVTVVGITPKEFTGTSVLISPELWTPLGMHELAADGFVSRKNHDLRQRSNHRLMLVGRLKPGLDRIRAEHELQALALQMAQDYPAENKDQTYQLAELPRMSINTNPSRDHFSFGAVLMMSMSAIILLIACLNLANMFLARSAARKKEFAVRLALGAKRIHIVRQLMLEGFLLSLLGGIAGLILAYWAAHLFVSALGPALPMLNFSFQIEPDWRVLTATLGFCLVATMLFSLAPVMKLTRTDACLGLKENAGSDRSGPQRFFNLRNLMVMGQIALTLALLAAGALFVRGAWNASQADPGFSLDRGIVAELDAGIVGLNETHARRTYLDLLEKVRVLPGVESASIASLVPFGMYSDGRSVKAFDSGRAAASPELKSVAQTNAIWAIYSIVGSDYFKSLGLPLLRGREFTTMEMESAQVPRVAVIDDTLAKQLFPDQDALGRRIVFQNREDTTEPESFEVIGVVLGVRHDLVDKKPQAKVYVPFGRYYQPAMTLHVRVKSNQAETQSTLIGSLRQSIRAVDKDLAVLSIRTFRHYVDESILFFMARMGAIVFMVMGGMALFLAVVGLYGTKAYLVARRTREIGIRMALGATGGSVISMVLKEGASLVVVGLGAGILLSLALGSVLGSVLYQVSPFDPLALCAAPLILAATAMLACFIPARRASLIQPVTALRCE